MPIIQVEDVSMRFNLAQEKTETLKEYTVKLLKHQLFFNEFYAVRKIFSFRDVCRSVYKEQTDKNRCEVLCYFGFCSCLCDCCFCDRE